MRQLVRVNHHRNCLLCHSPGHVSFTGGLLAPPPSDIVTAAVPIHREPLPSSATYYQTPDLAVRIDVVYLRQDFSIKLRIPGADHWPDMQRYDYLVRTHVLTEEEAKHYRDKLTPRQAGVLSPYHRAALAALRELTGRDAEPNAQAWRKLLGR